MVPPLRETVLTLPAGVVVLAVEPLSPPPPRVDTFRSYGPVEAVVVDTLPTWGFRVVRTREATRLVLRASRATSFRITYRPEHKPPSLAGTRDTLDLLIVAPRRFRRAVEAYAAMRETFGIRTEVVDLEEALQAPGGSRAERLRRYLQGYGMDRPVRHVFLVGPVPEVPVVYTRVDGIYPPLPFYERIPTDVFFSYHNPRPWNLDGDTLVGEVADSADPRTFFPLFHVGRLVIWDEEDLERYTRKVARYLMRGDPPRYVFHGPKLSPSLYGSAYLQHARTAVPSGVTVHTLFEEEGPIARDSFFFWMDRADLVVGVAHGYNDLYEINYDPWRDVRTPVFVRDSSAAPSVFFPIACEILAYDEGALGPYTLVGEGGPVVVYGMSRLDFPNYSQYLALWFMQALQQGARSIGEVDRFVRENLRLYTGLAPSIPRYLFFGYALLGDPSLPVRTRTPASVRVADLPLKIERVGPGWVLRGILPESRVAVWTARWREVFTSPYEDWLPGEEDLHLRVILPGFLPADTLLEAIGGIPEDFLEVRGPREGVEGESLSIEVLWRVRGGESLAVILPDTAWVMAVPPEGRRTFVVRVSRGGEGRVRVWGRWGEREQRWSVQVYPRFPTVEAIWVQGGRMRAVLSHVPRAWRGGALWMGPGGLPQELPTAPGPELWVGPPVEGVRDTLHLVLQVGGVRKDTVLSLQGPGTLPETLGVRSVPGGVEIYATDTVCSAYLWPEDTLLMHREALPVRLDTLPRGPVACVHQGVARVFQERASGVPGYPVRAPFPLIRADWMAAYTGPVPGRFLGERDVAVVGQDGRIHVVDPWTGDVRLYVEGVAPGSEVFTEAAVGDLGGDGQEDLFVPQRNPSGLRGLWNGGPVFIPLSVNVLWSPMVWDLDGDGRDEVYLTAGSRLYRVRETGGALRVDTLVTLQGWSWTTRPVLAPDRQGTVLGMWNGSRGALVRVSPAGQVDTLHGVWTPLRALAVGDLVAGGGLEIVGVGEDSGYVFRDSAVLYRFALSPRSPQVILLDWDQDGVMEFALKERGGAGYQVRVREATGEVRFTSPESWVLGLDFGTPLTACGAVLIYGNRGDDLYLWGAQPSRVFMGHKLGSGSFAETTGALWIASFLGPLWVLETSLSCGVLDWRTAHHDRRRTAHGAVEDLPTRVVERVRGVQIPRVLRASQTPWLELRGGQLYDRLGRLVGRDRIRIRGLPFGVYLLRWSGETHRVLVLP